MTSGTGIAAHGARPGTGLARNAFFLVVGQVVTTGLAILFNGVVGRLLGPTEFGVYFLVVAFSALPNTIVDWGQGFYSLREVARSPERGGDLLGTALTLRTLGTLLACIPTGLVAWALGYDLRTRWLMVSFIALGVPFLLSQFYGIVFRGRDRMDLDATVSVANKIAGLFFTLAALMLGRGLWGVIVAQALAGLIAVAVAARLYRRVATGPVRFSSRTAREMLTGGSALVTMNLAIWAQPYIDAVLLSKLVPHDAIGWYGAAKNIMGTLVAPALIVGAAAFPRLSRTAADPSSFALEVQTAIRPMLWLGALAGVGTFLFADTAIAILYGHKNFSPAGAILKVFAPGMFLIFIDMLLGAALTALGRSTAFSLAKIASVVLSTTLDLAFIPHFQRTSGNGGIGAVLSFVLSEAVIFSGSLYLMPRGSMGMTALLDALRSLAAAGLTVGAFLLLPGLSPWLGMPLAVVVFTACSLAVGLVRRGDVDLVRGIVNAKLARVSARA
jgi:O-antigen/teichoic acid export membrane protein